MILSAASLRRLYERYRRALAPTLVAVKRKPGEWLRVDPDSQEAVLLAESIGAKADDLDWTDKLLRGVAGERLNDILNVEETADDVRLAWFRNGKTPTVHIRFLLCAPGKKQSGRGGTPARASLPAALLEQFSLDLADEIIEETGEKEVGVRRGQITEKADLGPDGRQLVFSQDVPPDSTESEPAPEAPVAHVPDLSDLFDFENFKRALEEASDEDDSEIGRILAEVKEEFSATEAEIDPDKLIAAMRDRIDLAQEPDPIVDLNAPAADDWHRVSGQVVNATLDLVRNYRTQTGRLAVLAPSPGTGKTRGMAMAAGSDQVARRRVAYAVLSRHQIPEACDRIRSTSTMVRLHVIEGRHDGNCVNIESVQNAAALGYSPAQNVCPNCDKFPNMKNPVRSLNTTCGYYESRIRAVLDRKHAETFGYSPAYLAPIIVTTHASLAIGTTMTKRRLQNFWEFDTVFIDEDPTSAFETTVEIWDHQLVYKHYHQNPPQPDAHTMMTSVIRSAFGMARAERDEAHRRGYLHPMDRTMADPLHHRDHGSSYGGGPLLRLLDRAASSLGWDLHAVLAQVINESDARTPAKGELMGLDPAIAAQRFPHRYLTAVSHQLLAELQAYEATVLDLRALGDERLPDPAYKVHADLVLEEGSDPSTPGITHGVLRLHQAVQFGAKNANVILGDAYADISHYEHLFGRYRRLNQVDVISDRARWPENTFLIRMLTRCTGGEFPTEERFRGHLDASVRPVLLLEAGRSVLMYTHLATKLWLEKWLVEQGGSLGIAEWAIEHWGSGRGKDIYRDFDTFVAVTEYMPNIGGLLHEANAHVLTASPNALRVETPMRKPTRSSGGGGGSEKFAASIARAHPALLSAFQRKATDELAQAVHRIRPAIPSERPKHAWTFGLHVPLSSELLAATSLTIAKDTGDEGMTYETADGIRGMRMESATGTLGFISAREMATAMGEIYRVTFCWSAAFAHVLTGVPSTGDLRQLLCAQRSGETDVFYKKDPVEDAGFIAGADHEPRAVGSGAQSAEHPSEATPRPTAVPATPQDWDYRFDRLVNRVYSPPKNWQADAEWVCSTRVYREALAMLREALPQRPSYRVRRDWMPQGHHGYECWGNPVAFERILRYYGPNPPEAPF